MGIFCSVISTKNLCSYIVFGKMNHVEHRSSKDWITNLIWIFFKNKILWYFEQKKRILDPANPFHATDLFPYPLKTENQSFFDVFRGYRKRSFFIDVWQHPNCASSSCSWTLGKLLFPLIKVKFTALPGETHPHYFPNFLSDSYISF